MIKGPVFRFNIFSLLPSFFNGNNNNNNFKDEYSKISHKNKIIENINTSSNFMSIIHPTIFPFLMVIIIHHIIFNTNSLQILIEDFCNIYLKQRKQQQQQQQLSLFNNNHNHEKKQNNNISDVEGKKIEMFNFSLESISFKKWTKNLLEYQQFKLIMDIDSSLYKKFNNKIFYDNFIKKIIINNNNNNNLYFDSIFIITTIIIHTINCNYY